MDTYTEALEQVMNKLHDNFDQTNDQNIRELNNFIFYIDLLEQICNSIEKSISKDVLSEAQSDLVSSLIFCFQGYYRQANICLRSSIELILSFLYYYDHQYDFILWKNDCMDMTWTQLTNSDKGVFNNSFLSIVHGKKVDVSKCLEKIKELYHLTSQYVHGKYSYMQKNLNDRIQYSSELVDAYFKTSEEIIKLEIIMLYIRFNGSIVSCLDLNDISRIDNFVKEYEVIRNE